MVEDDGNGYAPNGRSHEKQKAFEAAEVDPEALRNEITP